MAGLAAIPLIASLTAAAPTIGAIGAGVTALGTIAGGYAQQSSANYQADQLDQQATQEVAAAGRESQERAREARLVLSRQNAVAGAGGFSATDQSVLDLAGETAAKGRFNQLMTVFGGEDRAAGMRGQAEGLRASGKAAVTGGYLAGAGTILQGASTFYGKYGDTRVAPKVGKPMNLLPPGYG